MCMCMCMYVYAQAYTHKDTHIYTRTLSHLHTHIYLQTHVHGVATCLNIVSRHYQNNVAHVTRMTCKKRVIVFQGLAESVTLGTLGYSESAALT